MYIYSLRSTAIPFVSCPRAKTASNAPKREYHWESNLRPPADASGQLTASRILGRLVSGVSSRAPSAAQPLYPCWLIHRCSFSYIWQTQFMCCTKIPFMFVLSFTVTFQLGVCIPFPYLFLAFVYR